MAKYKECWISPIDSTITGYLNTETGFYIPPNEENRHYRIFQNWLLGLDENGDPFDPPTGPQTPDPAFTAEEIAAYEAQKAIDDELKDKIGEYNIPAMSVAEREQMITDAFDGVVAVPELIDVLYDLLKKMIVYI